MEQRVALITGAGGGIGSVVVREFLKSGIKVAAVDLKEITQAEESQRTVGPGPEISWYRCDVSQKKDVDNLVDEVRENFRRIDILVNAAGITDRTPFFELSEEAWDKVLNINLKGTFLLSQVVLKCMIEQGHGGKIINLASIAGEVGGISTSANYSVSKAGTISLTKILAKIGGPHGITANAVSPGPVRTAMIDDWTPEEIEYYIMHTPLRRIGEPLDVAYAVCYLASPESSFISGQVIRVNGGFYV